MRIRRQLIDRQSGEGSAKRFDPFALVGCQILAGNQSAFTREERCNLLRYLALIECFRAITGNRAQGACQRGEALDGADRRNGSLWQEVGMPGTVDLWPLAHIG